MGWKSPGFCRNTQLAPSLCREEAYCRLPSPFASAALTLDEEKIPPDTFFRPYIRGNRCFGKSLPLRPSHLLRPQLLLRAKAYSVPSRCTYKGQYHAVKPTDQMPKRLSAFLLGPHHKWQGDPSDAKGRLTRIEHTLRKSGVARKRLAFQMKHKVPGFRVI